MSAAATAITARPSELDAPEKIAIRDLSFYYGSAQALKHINLSTGR